MKRKPLTTTARESAHESAEIQSALQDYISARESARFPIDELQVSFALQRYLALVELANNSTTN